MITMAFFLAAHASYTTNEPSHYLENASKTF